MLGFKAARPLKKVVQAKKVVRDKGLQAFRAYFGSSLWKMVGFKAARHLYKLKKVVRDKGFQAFRTYFGSSLWKMVGFQAARPLYKLKKWSGIRNLKLLESILAHLCGRCSGLRLRDLSTS